MIILATIGTIPATAAETTCSKVEAQLGVCSDGSAVTLYGDETRPGQSGQSGNGSNGDNKSGGNEDRVECIFAPIQNPAFCDPTRDIPTITISDIATFRPTPGRQRMEPDGWTVAGLDTNFYAITGPHVVNGTLLGRPADVRFTPISYRWAYGDGTSATRSTPGGTWAAQGIREFDPTPTSHVYEQVGDYTITLSIVFAAEYRFAGGPWRPVVGSITLPANDLHIRVGSAKTVLVEQDCAQNPAGPGC